jgi:hypothetical protein
MMMADDPWAVVDTKQVDPWSVVDHAPVAEPSTGADIGRGVGMGLIKGGTSILGAPADLYQGAVKGLQYAGTKGAELLGAITPEESERLRTSWGYHEDPVFGSANLQRGVSKLASKAGVDTTTEPKTIPGQYAETMASFAPAALAGPEGTLANLVKQAAIPAVVSETAGQLTKGTSLEPYARIAGAVAPGALMAGTRAAIDVANPLRKSLAGMTPAQENAAQELLTRSRQEGVPLTVDEAIQQVTNNGTAIGNVRRVVEQSPEGAAIIRPAMADRPDQVQTLGERTLNEIATQPNNPYTVAPRVQQAARTLVNQSPPARALDTAVRDLGPQMTAEEAGNVIRPELQTIYDRREGMRNALAERDYGAARDADYTTNGAAANPVTGVHDVINHIDDMLASAKGQTAAALRQARETLFTNGQPDMSVTGLSNARRAIADQISTAARSGNNDVARVLGDNGVLGQLDSALEAVPEYGQARRNFAAASRPLDPFADNTVPGRAIAQDEYGRNYTLPTEKIAPTIQSNGATGADQFLAAAQNSPDARNAFVRYFSQNLLDTARNPAGNINADVLANTLRQNQDILRRFPEITQRLNQVGAARRALEIVERTPVGELAQTSEFPKQANILFAANPLPGSERAIGATVRAIARTDPEAASQFVRMHIEREFNEGIQNNLPGANQFGAPKFAATIKGNPQQEANLRAAVMALPDGPIRWNALTRAMDIFEAIGKRQGAGSLTEPNRFLNAELQKGTLPERAAATVASPGKWPTAIADMYKDMVYRRNTSQLARVFTEGNVADLKAIVAPPRRSVQAQTALAAALARQSTATDRSSTQPNN